MGSLLGWWSLRFIPIRKRLEGKENGLFGEFLYWCTKGKSYLILSTRLDFYVK